MPVIIIIIKMLMPSHRTNEDDFLPVDLAAMLNYQSVVRLLLERGGKDSAKCKSACNI